MPRTQPGEHAARRIGSRWRAAPGMRGQPGGAEGDFGPAAVDGAQTKAVRRQPVSRLLRRPVYEGPGGPSWRGSSMWARITGVNRNHTATIPIPMAAAQRTER